MTAVEMKKADIVCLEEKTNELEEAFFSSSHFTRWLLPNTTEVRNRRWQTFENDCIIKDKTTSNDESLTALSADITEEDYNDYCLMLCEKCIEICKTFRLSEQVQWTAVILLKRSLLDKSVLEWTSHACLVGCVSLIAAKSEGSVIALSDLSKVFRQSTLSEEIMASEMQVLESIKFDLRVWQSLPSLRSLCNDFWKFLEKKKYSSSKKKKSSKKKGSSSLSSTAGSSSSLALESIELKSELRQSLDDQSNNILRLCLQTDCPLVFTPSQMSLACFLLAASNTEGLKDSALEYFNALFSRTFHASKLKQCTESIQRLIIESMQRSQEFNEASRVKLQNKMDRLRRSVVSAQKKKRNFSDSVSTDEVTGPSSSSDLVTQRFSDRTLVQP